MTTVLADVDPLQEEPYYIQACSWLRLSNPDKAYHTMKGATIQIDAPSRDTLCLCAFIAVRIVPPRYMEGVDSLSAVLKNTPNDFDAVGIYGQTCCYTAGSCSMDRRCAPIAQLRQCLSLFCGVCCMRCV